MNKFESHALSIITSKRKDRELAIATTLLMLRRDPEYAKIENQKCSLELELLHLLRGNTPFFPQTNTALATASTDIQSQIDDLSVEISKLNTRLLARQNELNVSTSSLTMVYDCTVCLDTGFVNNHLCNCVKNLTYELLLDDCKIRITDIDTFSSSLLGAIEEPYRTNYARIYAICSKFIKEFGNLKKNILGLAGVPATGKTFIASIIANAIVKQGFPVLMLSSFQLNRIFLEYHTTTIDRKSEVFEPLLSAELLILDDLGSENIFNNVTINYLYELLVLRDKPIIYTTNLDADGLEKRYGERIYSRLLSKSKANFYIIESNDLRKKQQGASYDN